ncbi:hypothetical protein O181_035327 [Austropuccinia psidii MF-1]|uniref:Uncharacterized protein n=1 Tax=Austropuccinia psidii MF-1 TaxID=1389203 RepID=A0A9Q3H8W7_9BASI|nr:hypothetical protein [Austropuccinia psidii MF-1]
MSPVHLRNQSEDRQGLFRIRRPGSGQHSGWKDTEGNHINTAIHLPIQQEGWKDMDNVLQLHRILKDLFQWNMDSKRFNLASHWEELGESCQKICLKEIPFKDLMLITKGGNSNRKFKLLEEKADRIRENKATTQYIEEQLNQKEHTLIPSGSQGVKKSDSPVASHHSGTGRSVTKSHHYSQSQVISRRRQVSKGKNKTSFNQR